MPARGPPVRVLRLGRPGAVSDGDPAGFVLNRKLPSFTGIPTRFWGAAILEDLRTDGENVSRKTVAKTMWNLGLAAVCPKKSTFSIFIKSKCTIR